MSRSCWFRRIHDLGPSARRRKRSNFPCFLFAIDVEELKNWIFHQIDLDFCRRSPLKLQTTTRSTDPVSLELRRLYRGSGASPSGQNCTIPLQCRQCKSQANEGRIYNRDVDISSFQLNTFTRTLNNCPEKKDICFCLFCLLLKPMVSWTLKNKDLSRWDIFHTSQTSSKYEYLFLGDHF